MRLPCDQSVIASGDGAEPCSKSSAPWVLAATIFGSSMAFIDSTVVNVALPQLQTRLGGSVVDVQWVVESYALFLSALILVGGSIGDLLGRRRIFVLGLAVFTAASVACGFAENIRQLIAARAIQGIGAAFLVPGSLSIISASFSKKDRGQAIGTWTSFTSITTAMGPVLGGWLIQHWSWRAAFFLNVPIGLAVILISMIHVPESKGQRQGRVDLAGAAAITGGLAGVTYGLIESSARGWNNPVIWAAFIAGCLLLAAFFYIEAREHSPMVPLGIFRSRAFASANLLTLFLYAGLGIFFFLFPLDFIQIQNHTPAQTGIAILPFILLMFLLSRWSGGLVARYGPRLPLIIGPVIVGLGYLLFAIPTVGGSYWIKFFPALVILGFGMAISVAPLTTVVMEALDQQQSGIASGVNNAVARLAGLLAVAVLGIVMVAAFSSRMNSSIGALNLPVTTTQYLQANETKLADLPIPPHLDSNLSSALRRSIEQAFVFGFRLVMLICAALAFLGAAAVWRTDSSPRQQN